MSPLPTRSRSRSRLRLAAAGALAVLLASCSLSGKSPVEDDWPMYGGTPQRNMVNQTVRNLPTQWSVQQGNQKNIKWVVDIGTRGYASPVVSGGKVYVGTNNGKPRDPQVTGEKAVLMCFRESDGQFLWQITHDMPPPEIVREARQDGLCSTPAIDGDHLYYVTPGAQVICADTSGKILWQLDLVKEQKVFPCYLCNCSPFVVGDLVYVVTGNGRDAENNLPSPDAPSFVAVDKKTGKLAWRAPSVPNITEGQWGNPAYADAGGRQQVIFPGGDGALYAFEAATGKPTWKFNCVPKPAAENAGRGARNYLIATPGVADGRVYVGVGQNPDNGAGAGDFWCVDVTKNGDVSPASNGTDGAAKNGSGLVWHYGGAAPKGAPRDYLFGRTLSGCAVHDGLIYIGELDGFIHCLDAKTGQHYWEEDLKSSVWGSPYWADGKVYQGTDDGDIHIFAHGKDKKVLAKVEMEEAVKSTPTAANGVLYVTTDKHLYAIAQR